MELYFVSSEINKLNPDWYDQKMSYFRKHKYYIEEINRVSFSDTYSDHYWDHEINQAVHDEGEMLIDFGVEEYCWSHISQEEIDYIEDNKMDLILPKGNDVTEKILKVIKYLSDGISETRGKYQLIKSVLDEARLTVENNKVLRNDISYHAALDYFYDQFSETLKKAYLPVLFLYKLEDFYPSKEVLKFDINQEQLATLLFLLVDAEIIHTPYLNDTRFIDFCERHFYFKNQKTKSHTPANSLRNKFSDAKKDKSLARDRIIQLLQKTLKRWEKGE